MYNVPFRFNPFFPLNTMQLMRGATVYLEQPEFQAYLTAVFNGIWAEKLNMESPEVIADVLSKAGIDVTDFMNRIGQPEVKARLKAITSASIRFI